MGQKERQKAAHSEMVKTARFDIILNEETTEFPADSPVGAA